MKPAFQDLTEQDLRVLSHSALSASEAAKLLNARPSTYRTMVERVFNKIGATSKATAVLIAIRFRILDAEEFVLPSSLDLDGFEFDKFKEEY